MSRREPEADTSRPPTGAVIVVATADFDPYHAVVGEPRERGATFTTTEPGEALPDRASVVVPAATDGVSYETVEHVTTPDTASRRR